MTDTAWLWIGFNVFVLLMLALDLGVFHRDAHVVSFKEALTWSGVWIALALIFNAGLWYYAGDQKALEFFTGYLIEKSLSVDNIFVFALLFGFFAVPAKYQHKVLFWGILSALVMRALMIWAGAALIAQFSWVIYVFGAFLIFTGLKMLIVRADATVDPEKNIVVRLFKRFVPMTRDFRGDRFTVVENGKRVATPLLLVLVLVEIADIVFAVDSIPAIFAVTKDPFLVYTSNVFAILGLRSLYFALAGIMHRFVYLKTGLALVLTFVGIKMILGHTPWKIDTLLALGVVASILTGAVVLSLWKTKSHAAGVAVPPRPVEET
jgi:tellurite resistance protein TerC